VSVGFNDREWDRLAALGLLEGIRRGDAIRLAVHRATDIPEVDELVKLKHSHHVHLEVLMANRSYRYGVCVEITSPERLTLRQIRAALTARQWSFEELSDAPVALKAYDAFRLPRPAVKGN